MEKKDKRPVYEPPRSIDLSAYSASGEGTLGICQAGPSPFEDCLTGFTFQVPGRMMVVPPPCDGGALPEQTSCSDGSSALAGCIAGGEA